MDRTSRGVPTVTLQRLLDLDASPEEQAARDRQLLDQAAPAVRVALLRSSAISLGVSQTDDAPAARRAREVGIPVVRRGSGGTAVFHAPGDVTFTIILPRSAALVGRDFTRAYGRLGAGVVERLRSWGVAANWTDPPGLSEEFCLWSSRGKVLSVGGRVLGGAAQHLTATTLLHHGLLLGDPHRDALRRLLELPEGLLKDRLVGLNELPVPNSGAVRATELLKSLHTVLERDLASARGSSRMLSRN